MPPKAKAAKAQDKAKVKDTAKKVEDKTFGLKNKNKSKSVQQYVQRLEKSVQQTAKQRGVAPETNKKDKKKAAEEQAKELNDLFAVAIKQPKVPVGVDPKSIVCEFFRHGQCGKGFKCKFSHDLNVERKGGKIDIFTDRREEDGMEDWDQDKLEEVVQQKHAAEKGQANKTDIICKFFLEAVEAKKYGWFWVCPNGKECKYRHGLPPGYVLKSQMKELLEAEAQNKVSIEDEIEEQRSKVDAKTPINEATFKAWQAKKQAEKRKREADTEAERRRKGLLTGREIFMQDGFTAEDDVGASDTYTRENDEEAEFRRVQEAARAAQEAAHAAHLTAGASSKVPQPSGTSASSPEEAQPPTGPGPSGTNGSMLQLSQEDEALFMDEDDDDDLDEGDLDELAADIQQKAAVG